MLKIINCQLLKNNELLPFAMGLNDFFNNFNAETDRYALSIFVTKLNTSTLNFKKSFMRNRKNPFTEKLGKADHMRNNAFYALREYLKSCLNLEEPGIVAAAERLLRVIRRHGWSAASKGKKKKTAAFTKILAEFGNSFAADLELVGGYARYKLLETRENDYDDLMKTRVSQPPSKLPAFKDSRPELVDTIRKLLTLIDIHYSENQSDPILASYVNAINTLITRTMSAARAGRTRKNKKKEEQDSQSEI